MQCRAAFLQYLDVAAAHSRTRRKPTPAPRACAKPISGVVAGDTFGCFLLFVASQKQMACLRVSSATANTDWFDWTTWLCVCLWHVHNVKCALSATAILRSKRTMCKKTQSRKSFMRHTTYWLIIVQSRQTFCGLSFVGANRSIEGFIMTLFGKWI